MTYTYPSNNIYQPLGMPSGSTYQPWMPDPNGTYQSWQQPITLSDASAINIQPYEMDPSPEIIEIAAKILHDPNFDVGKFIIKLLAKYIQNHLYEALQDETMKKHLED